MDQQLMQEVRSRVLDLVSQEARDLVDEQDVDRQVRSRDTLIRMFCQQCVEDHDIRDVEAIGQRMLQTLIWRKSYGLTTVKASDFPLELWSKGHYVKFEDGDIFISIFDSAKYKRFSDRWADLMTRFTMYIYDKHVIEAVHAGKKVIMFTSLKNMTHANLDMKRDTESVTLFDTHFPCLCDHMGGYGAPWYLNGIGNAFIRFTMPSSLRKRFQLYSKDSIRTALPPHLLPQAFGGPLVLKSVVSVENDTNIKPLAEWGPKNGFTDAEIDKILEHYKHLSLSS